MQIIMRVGIISVLIGAFTALGLYWWQSQRISFERASVSDVAWIRAKLHTAEQSMRHTLDGSTRKYICFPATGQIEVVVEVIQLPEKELSLVSSYYAKGNQEKNLTFLRTVIPHLTEANHVMMVGMLPEDIKEMGSLGLAPLNPPRPGQPPKGPLESVVMFATKSISKQKSLHSLAFIDAEKAKEAIAGFSDESQEFPGAPELESYLEASFVVNNAYFGSKRPIGGMHVMSYTDSRGKKHAYIEAMVVDQEHRGRGIASKLMRRALTALKNQQFSRVVLKTDVRKVMEIYTHLGFKVLNRGTIPGVQWEMAKDLEE